MAITRRASWSKGDSKRRILDWILGFLEQPTLAPTDGKPLEVASKGV